MTSNHSAIIHLLEASPVVQPSQERKRFAQGHKYQEAEAAPSHL